MGSILLALFSSFAFAQNSVPVVSAETFAPGHVWEWTYSQNDEFYSSERYTVVSRQGSALVIEMSTRLAGETAHRTHHRLHVDVAQCLAAYRNPAAPGAWSFKMFYLLGDTWQVFDPGSTLAFEEKFNCNPHVYSAYGANYKTVFHDSRTGRLFEHKRWGRLNGSRFYLEGENAGVASEKDFPKPQGQSYKFKLVD